jgi:hypothetical protein
MLPDVLAAMLEGTWNFAKVMLRKTGDFYPFAETADRTGKRSMVGGSTGQEHPNPRSIYSLLHDALASQVASGEAAAVALAANVNIPAEYQSPFPDGVRVHVEAAGYCRYVYLPYRVAPRGVIKRTLGRPFDVAYGEPISVDLPPIFFSDRGST